MQFRLVLAIALLASGCSISAPKYTATQIADDAEHPHIILSRFRQRLPWPRGDSIDYQQSYFLTDARFAGATRLAEENWGEDSRYAAIGDAPGAMLRVHTDRAHLTIDVLHANTPKRLLELTPQSAASVAYAITSSGNHLLVVDDRSLRIVHCADGAVVLDESAGQLLEFRRAILSYYGSVGRWRVTDDLRYILLETPQLVRQDGMIANVPPAAVMIDNDHVELDQFGIGFDRHSQGVFKFRLNLPADPDEHFPPTLLGGESIQGLPVFLYLSKTGTLTLASPDLKHQRICPATLNVRNFFDRASDVDPFNVLASVAVKWSPARHQLLWLETRGVRDFWSLKQEDQPETEAGRLGCWDLFSDDVRLERFTVGDVQRCIDER